ncbi:MAG: COX15/CtaA family protein [Pirellulaceae bacterium]|nr:COX15/CtaA family protein [Pirellulaceae bacterium]
MQQARQTDSRGPHRWATLLVCATFPLIWVGGLVTTYDAGMAVPDWPGTYGYNLFLYPWQTWIFGPWDLLIEHGHRLLGALVGLLTIGLLVSVWRRDDRSVVRWLAVGTLVMVLLQGGLGGMRVLLDDRQLALLHGCTGPAFFGLATVMWVLTSRFWAQSVVRHEGGGALHRLSLLTVGLAYLQLVAGAHLRHLPVHASPDTFRVYLVFHLLGAALLAGHLVLLVATIARSYRSEGWLTRPAGFLSGLLVCQLLLGAGSWVMKYGWPAGADRYAFIARHVIEADGLAQSLIVTGHAATGSLILATSMVLALRSLRLVAARASETRLRASWGILL